jgi:hypothetical protein
MGIRVFDEEMAFEPVYEIASLLFQEVEIDLTSNSDGAKSSLLKPEMLPG